MKPILFMAGLAGFLPIANAATLSGTVTTTGLPESIDLSATGSTNWALWHYTMAGVTSAANIAPSNQMGSGPSAGTAGYIGNAFRVGGSAGATIRGGNGQTLDVSYSNGVSPISTTVTNTRMVFASDLNTVGQGVGLTVTGNPSQLYRISVWASGLDGVGTMTASTAGQPNVVLTSQTYGANGGDGQKAPTLFTFLFQPDNMSDLLTLSYILSADGTGSTTSHVGISAVTVEVIPEPSVAGLTVLGALACLRRRRR